MQKFTVFTVILTILVVVVSAETFVNKYLPSLTKADISSPTSTDQLTLPKELDLENTVADETKILSGTNSGSSMLNTELLGVEAITPSAVTPSTIETQSALQSTDTPNSQSVSGSQSSFDTQSTIYNQSTSNTQDILDLQNSFDTQSTIYDQSALDSQVFSNAGTFDIEGFSGGMAEVPTGASLNNITISNSGFINANVTKESYDNMLYKTINTADLIGIKVDKYVISDDVNTFAKVYVMSFDGSTILDDTYNVIKLRASQLSDVQINETNEFGLGSFYMNDIRRSGVAFLTVKIGDKIYGFTYPKEYHPQIKNLISLLLIDF